MLIIIMIIIIVIIIFIIIIIISIIVIIVMINASRCDVNAATRMRWSDTSEDARYDT